MPIEQSAMKDVITQHFAALKNQTIVVEEWGKTIHFHPVTARERDELNRVKGDNELYVETLILKSLDEDGAPLFTKADKPWLMREASVGIIRIIASRILTADIMDVKKLGEPLAPPPEL